MTAAGTAKWKARIALLLLGALWALLVPAAVMPAGTSPPLGLGSGRFGPTDDDEETQPPPPPPGSESADLGVTIGPDLVRVTVGEAVTVTVVVFNAGAAAAIGVRLADTLPAGLILVSAATTQGSCSGDVSCAIGTLQAGDFATVTIVAKAVTPGTIANRASVGAVNPDPDVSNNYVSSTIHVGGATAPTTHPETRAPPQLVSTSVSLSASQTVVTSSQKVVFTAHVSSSARECTVARRIVLYRDGWLVAVKHTDGRGFASFVERAGESATWDAKFTGRRGSSLSCLASQSNRVSLKVRPG